MELNVTLLLNNLFPENSIDAATKLLKLRRELENSIPVYLEGYGFNRLVKAHSCKDMFIRFIDYRRKIFLCYRKSDITANTNKSRESKQKLINSLYDMQMYNTNYQVVYGYLLSNARENNNNINEDIIFNNITITVLSGLKLLNFLFGD